MAQVDVTRIASNIGALNALNSLQNINSKLAMHQTRLSTGKRINSAADDPAGLTIATKMISRSEGLKVAFSNIGDASNMLSVAEAGLSKMNDILVIMRNKAEQAASDTLGSDERKAIQTQVSAYAAQIDDIVSQTKWNSTKLLDGSVSGLRFQTGVDNGEYTSWNLAQSHTATSLDISKVSTGSSTFQGNTGTVGAAVTNAWDSSSGVVNLLGGGTTNGLSALATGRYQFNVLDVASGGTAGVAANAKFSVTNDGSTQGTLTKNAIGTNPTAELASGSGYTFAVTSVSGAETGQTVNFQITDSNGNSVATGNTSLADGVTSVLSGSVGLVGSLGISLTKTDGQLLSQGDTFTFDYLRGGDAKVSLTDISGIAQTIDSDGLVAGTTTGKAAYVSLAAAASTVVNTGRGVSVTMGQFSTAAANNFYKFDWEAVGNNTINVSTAALASTYMDKVSTAINVVSDSMATLGSLMARLDFKGEQVSNAQVNVEGAYSRIMNANMAEEQMNASKYTILQQTAVAMLAQANQAPQSLLTLFR